MIPHFAPYRDQNIFRAGQSTDGAAPNEHTHTNKVLSGNDIKYRHDSRVCIGCVMYGKAFENFLNVRT